jgi:hypothetical protein
MKAECRAPPKQHQQGRRVHAADADEEHTVGPVHNYYFDESDEVDHDLQGDEQTGFVGTLDYLN